MKTVKIILAPLPPAKNRVPMFRITQLVNALQINTARGEAVTAQHLFGVGDCLTLAQAELFNREPDYEVAVIQAP